MRNRVVLLILIICLLSGTSGCWDIKDVNNTAFALSIGIDKPPKSSTAKYLVTLEFTEPVTAKPHISMESLTTSAEGDSILQAVQSIQTDISRTVSLSHLRVVIIGEEIAKEKDFKSITNYLMRNPQVAWRLRLIFVQGDAAQNLFYAKHNFEQLLGAEIVSMGQSQEDLSYVRTNNFLDFMRNLNRTKGTAVGSRVTIKEKAQVYTRDGGAVYKKWKLAGWLSTEETQGANWLVEKTRPIVFSQEGKNSYTYQTSRFSRKITPVVANDKLSFLVKINTVGMVMEQDGPELDFSKPGNLKKMELLFSSTIKQQVNYAVEKSQSEIKADYLGFDRALEQNNPELFKALNWEKVYPTIPIEVQVSCKIKSYGLRS
ncbi:MAG: Ger(x)C family spore germination protein [Dehalobacterium sp.]